MTTKSPIFSLSKKDIFSILFLVITGSAFHFLYDWLNESRLIAWFVPVNESTWEHLKLLFFPATILTVYEFFKYDKNYDFLTSRILALFLGLISIPILFYSYKAIVGRDFIVIDILIFVIAVIIFWYMSKFFYNKPAHSSNVLFIIVGSLYLIVFLMFIIFTFYPPTFFLFKDPLTNSYGI